MLCSPPTAAQDKIRSGDTPQTPAKGYHPLHSYLEQRLAYLKFLCISSLCYNRIWKICYAGREWSVSKQANIEVTFYTKAGCHLCEDARELLEEIAQETHYILTEIDIRNDMTSFEMYRYRIPVIIIQQGILLEGRIDAGELARAFQQATGE
jgi:glutaredoxin